MTFFPTKLLTAPALLLLVFGGCQPASEPGEIKPFAIKTNDGIAHELYRDLTLEQMLQRQPSGSVDFVDIDTRLKAPVYALVKVPEQAEIDLTKKQFETIFQTAKSQAIKKTWRAVREKQTGKAIGFFTLPADVVDAKTQIVDVE